MGGLWLSITAAHTLRLMPPWSLFHDSVKTTFALHLCSVTTWVTVNRVSTHAHTHTRLLSPSQWLSNYRGNMWEPSRSRPAHLIRRSALRNSRFNLFSRCKPEVSTQTGLSATWDSGTREAATLFHLLSTVADDRLEKSWCFTRLRVPSQPGCFLYFLAAAKAQAPEGSESHFFPFNVSRMPYALQYLGYIYTWELPSITTTLQCGPKRSSSSDALKDSLTFESAIGSWMTVQSLVGGGNEVKVQRQSTQQ